MTVTEVCDEQSRLAARDELETVERSLATELSVLRAIFRHKHRVDARVHAGVEPQGDVWTRDDSLELAAVQSRVGVLLKQKEYLENYTTD